MPSANWALASASNLFRNELAPGTTSVPLVNASASSRRRPGLDLARPSLPDLVRHARWLHDMRATRRFSGPQRPRYSRADHRHLLRHSLRVSRSAGQSRRWVNVGGQARAGISHLVLEQAGHWHDIRANDPNARRCRSSATRLQVVLINSGSRRSRIPRGGQQARGRAPR